MEKLDEGMSLTKVGDIYPEHLTFIVLHADRLNNFFTQRTLERAKPILTFGKAQTKFLPSAPWDTQIVEWLNLNLLQVRAFSQKQLWIWGPTSHGKTTLKNDLEQCLRIYTVPNEDFYDEYKDSLYDVIIFDEFVGDKKITWMNNLCDGSTISLRQKGHQIMKRDKKPVIVLSNRSIRQCYSHVSMPIFETINRRFVEVSLGAPIEVEILNTGNMNAPRAATTELDSRVTTTFTTPAIQNSQADENEVSDQDLADLGFSPLI